MWPDKKHQWHAGLPLKNTWLLPLQQFRHHAGQGLTDFMRHMPTQKTIRHLAMSHYKTPTALTITGLAENIQNQRIYKVTYKTTQALEPVLENEWSGIYFSKVLQDFSMILCNTHTLFVEKKTNWGTIIYCSIWCLALQFGLHSLEDMEIGKMSNKKLSLHPSIALSMQNRSQIHRFTKTRHVMSRNTHKKVRKTTGLHTEGKSSKMCLFRGGIQLWGEVRLGGAKWRKWHNWQNLFILRSTTMNLGVNYLGNKRIM